MIEAQVFSLLELQVRWQPRLGDVQRREAWFGVWGCVHGLAFTVEGLTFLGVSGVSASRCRDEGV